MKKDWKKPNLTVVIKVRSEGSVLAVCKGTSAPWGGPHQAGNSCAYAGADCKATAGSL